MDLVTGLPYTRHGFDAIFSLIDKFSKWVTFVPCNKSDGSKELAALFVRELVRRHGVPKVLISDRD